MCSHRAHLKRRNPSLALPHGQLDGDQDTALWEAGWGTLQPYYCLGRGRGCVGKGKRVTAALLAVPRPPLPPDPVRASGCCGRISQDPILMELGSRAHGGSPGMARCVLGCSPPQPHHTCARGNCFYFSTSEAAGRFCSKRNNALRGEEFPPAAPARAGTKGL